MAFNAGDIEAKLTIDRRPFRLGLAESRKEAEAFEKRGIKVRLNLDKSAIDRLDRQIHNIGKGARGVSVPVTVTGDDLDKIRTQIDRIGDSSETTARRSGNRLARALLNPLVLQLGLIPGIAAAAGAAGALALGVLPIAIGAIGIAAVKNNEQVKSAYAGLWNDIKTEAEAIAEPLVGTFVDVSHRIFGAWRTMRPELAAMFKDSAPLIEEFVDGILGAAEEAVPRFRQAIQVSGPAMRGFSSLVRDLGAGVGEMSVEISEGSSDVGRSAELTGQMVRDLLGTVGELVRVFAGAWADIGPQFTRIFDAFTDAVVGFTEGGLRGLGDGLNLTMGMFEGMLNILGPFADVFGQVAGYALSARASWILFAGAIGLVAKAWNLLKPSEWIGRLSGVSAAMSNAAAASGGWVTRMTGSEKAGERFTTVANKMGNAVVKTAASLPLLGTAFAIGKAAIDHFWPSADTLADKIQQGGAAAEEARGQMYDLGMGYNQGSLWAQTFAATGDEVQAAIDKQRASMTGLERAQQDASKAQRDYDYAVDRFGKNSPQAVQAQKNLAYATDEVAYQQDKAAEATQTHTDKIIEQTNLMLGAIGARLNYQSSLQNLEEAQRNATDAIKEHGVGSLEARTADTQYQQAILSTVNALGQRVLAENAALGETKASELATAAMRMEIARLAVEAGTNLPPALAEMAAGLTDAELKAFGVERQVTDTGTAIYVMPDGKQITFPTNAPITQGKIETLTTAIYNLPTGDRWLNYYLNYVVKGSPPAASNQGNPGMLGNATGQRAQGGPVKANSAYWVGERGEPELFFPNIDGFVLSGRDSKELMRRMNGVPAERRIPFAGGDGASIHDGPGLTAEQVEQAFRQALSDIRLQIDGDQWATVVNKTNARNGVR
jgi:hypothetical protein